MKKNILTGLIALLPLMFVLPSCKKSNDLASIEQNIPSISLSSLGAANNGPFGPGDKVQLTFGATTTKASTGTFDVAIYDNKTLTTTVHFNSWSGQDVTGKHSIAYTTVPTSYSNTTAYTGTITLSVGDLGLTQGVTANKSITVTATAKTADAKSSTFTTSNAFVLKHL